MKLKNYTDIPNSEIREMTRFCKPVNVSHFDLRISNSYTSTFRGRFYPKGCYYHETLKPLIVVRVTKDAKKFPLYTRHTKGGGYIDTLLLNREEAFLLVIAHEIRHLWQKHHPHRKVWQEVDLAIEMLMHML
jgi:hypothetical protein